jgi:acyl-CoA dehydrogenase
MDFQLSEEATALAGLAADIANKLVTTDRLLELESAPHVFDDALWAQLAGSGLLGIEIAEAHGGSDLGVVENCAVAEELGRALARVPFGATAMVAAPAIAAFGSEAQKGRWLPDIGTGATIFAVALDEDLNNDPANPATIAKPTDGGWQLDGAKVDVGYADVADAILVNAQGPDGPRVFIVLPGDPGVTITPTRVTGLTSAATIELTAVALDDSRILGGAETNGFVVDRLTLALCADQTGVLEQALALTAEYGREREQFGKKIGSFQAVAQRLADGYIDVRGLKLTTLQAAWLLGEADSDYKGAAGPADKELATAKFWAADAGHRVAHTTVHVHGGVGIDTDHPVHRYFLAAKQNEFSLGSGTAHLRRLGAQLAAEPA